ncbi:AAA family ATPase [Streptomyces albireticuli]|uniref:Septum formation initiator n=1 Tax=Streptomyces albireticuli TaxID=1940 RepID=A0A2A2CVL8_9ACTN|nr:AAA family ATPase [Streptomyces albireticuli]MCD9142672.1 AAA family ATPase [Streptomyces albireticuli]MCD9163009.1 AAA family ATPase [Streptomyces albireticuli]MCD9192800.1 AAA family ATPase [Streptomyces albireticuli]PAU44258.1 septum formation initiator [Streptomyces albireticuli]
MTIRILPAVGDPDAARAIGGLLGQLPGVEPLRVVEDATRLLDTLAVLAAASVADLPEVVLVHERLGPLPALELIREVALRFPATGVVLVTATPSPALYAAAMDAGARGLAGLPLSYEELGARVQAAAHWATGVRRHLGSGPEALTEGGAGGSLVAVVGAKGGVGTTVTAVQLALAASAAGRAVALVDLDLQAGDVASYLDVQFRRSIADLAGISDISPRVLQDAVFPHPTGLGLLLAPAEGERGEEVGDLAARQIAGALRGRYELVVVDCGTQITAAGAAMVELADVALLVTTPDVVSVRGAKRMVRLWERLQIRKAEETTTVVNRHSRSAEIQPPLVERTTGTKTARTTVPAGYKDLQPAVDSGRMQDLDARSPVRQALWALAAELGLAAPAPGGSRGPAHADRSLSGGLRRRRAALGPGGTGPDQLAPVPASRFRRRGGDRGQVAVEFLGLLPLVLVVLAVVWQCVLIGYTYSLAGDAADKGARAGAAGGDCVSAARADVPGAWGDGGIGCGAEGGVYRARVSLPVPVLFPGAADWPWTVEGSAGAARED